MLFADAVLHAEAAGSVPKSGLVAVKVGCGDDSLIVVCVRAHARVCVYVCVCEWLCMCFGGDVESKNVCQGGGRASA